MTPQIASKVVSINPQRCIYFATSATVTRHKCSCKIMQKECKQVKASESKGKAKQKSMYLSYVPCHVCRETRVRIGSAACRRYARTEVNNF